MDACCPQCQSRSVRHIAAFADFAAAIAPHDTIRVGMVAFMQAHPAARFEQILACDVCGLRVVHPLPNHAALSDFYAHYAGNAGYAKKLKSKLKRGRKRARMLAQHTQGRRFLDVGCNIGCAVEAARLAGFHATGIEIGDDAVAQAKQLFPENRFFATDIASFAATGEQFDAVYCTEVIEHVPDTVGFVRALAQLMAPGAVLFLTTPDAGHWRRPKDFLSWNEVKPPEHLNWQTRKSLTTLFTAHGFDAPRFRFSLKPGMKMIVRRAA